MLVRTTKKHQQCQELFDAWYPNYRNAGQLYQDLVSDYIEKHSRALDLGCGQSTLADRQIVSAQFTAGIDTSFSDLKANRAVGFPISGMAEAVPFARNSFDVVLSQWVMEHLPRPDLVFTEVARILKPGGTFIVFTTNIYNYIPLTSRLVPSQIQSKLLRTLLGRPQHETFPTHYRANSRQALAKLAEKGGLVMESCTYSGNPFYLTFSRLLFLGALLFERVTDFPPLQKLKLYILGVFRKPSV